MIRLIKGPQKDNKPRKLAMYLCQQLARAMAKLTDIDTAFQLGHVGSVSFITHQVQKRAKYDVRVRQQVERLIKSIVKQATYTLSRANWAQTSSRSRLYWRDSQRLKNSLVTINNTKIECHSTNQQYIAN